MLGTVRRYKKEILIGIILFSLPYFIPLYGVGIDAGTLVTAVSTIFAIFAGFLIADAMANYLRLQSLISEENSALITVADDSEQISKDRCKAVHEAIDQYMIAQLDLDSLNHFSQTQKQMDNLHAAVHQLSTGSEGGVLYDHILTMEEKIITTRQEMALAAKQTLTPMHWITLISLAALVVVSLLPIRNGEWLTNVFVGFMILGTGAILVILRDMDNNRFLERKLSFENPGEVFHAIDKPPYYPANSPAKVRVPNEKGEIRVGDEGGLQNLVNTVI